VKAQINNQRGTSAVEFAIVLPLLVLFIFGIIEFGLIFYNKAMVTNASREAARAGIVYRDPPVSKEEMSEVVNNYCENMLVSFGSSLPHETLVPSDVCDAHGKELVVNVVYRYEFLMIPDFLTTFFSGGLPGSIDVSAVTRMRCE
jgi:Flp pilus assembly protein TadG